MGESEMIEIKKLHDLSITRRPDLKNHPDLQKSRPPAIGVCVESGVFQYDNTNIVQWWIARDGMWFPYGKDVYVINKELNNANN